MSVNMEQAADAILQAAHDDASSNELSDIDVDGDGSSSLSDLDTKDSQQDEDAEGSDNNSDQSEDENDSEAETERLEESPNKVRTQKDVVLSSHNSTYERSPSKLNKQIIPEELDQDEDDDPLSDDEMSIIDSPKSSVHEADAEPPTATTSLEDSAGEGKRSLSVGDADTRKRKRSIMAGGALDEDLEEPLPKRTGSVLTPGDDYAIEDDDQADEDNGTSNPISVTISGEEDGEDQDDEVPEEIEEIEEPIAVEEEVPQAVEDHVAPKKRGRKKKKGLENGANSHDEEADLVDGHKLINGEDEVANGGEENGENEADDEAEAALRSEEERRLLLIH